MHQGKREPRGTAPLLICDMYLKKENGKTKLEVERPFSFSFQFTPLSLGRIREKMNPLNVEFNLIPRRKNKYTLFLACNIGVRSIGACRRNMVAHHLTCWAIFIICNGSYSVVSKLINDLNWVYAGSNPWLYVAFGSSFNGDAIVFSD